MKTNNTAIALIGLLAYKPENIAYISDRLRPEMFPGSTLQSLAGAMWASYEAKQAWGAQDLRDFDEVLAEQALARPLPQDKLEQTADKLRAGWEARNIADIYQQAAKVAAKGDGIGARQQAEAQLELLQSSIALPDEKQAVIMRSIKHMEKYFKSSPGKRVTGIDTGFLYLNTETAGWQAGDINILAALPGRGKTTMALQSAIVAARLGHPVLFFSVGDSTAEQLYLKSAAIIAGIDFARILRNTITPEEKGRMSRAYEELSELPLRIYDTSQFNGTTGAIRDIARRDAINWPKMGLLVVDYIQQLRPLRYIANVVDRIEEVSANIKHLTVSLHCSSLVLSQFSRDSAKGGIEREPVMSDLRGSGAIEQDASRIITIHTENGAVKLVMLKDRHGAMKGAKSVGIETKWLPEIGRYEWVYDSPFSPPASALTSAMVEAQPGKDDNIPF